ncbi:bifunctional diaminohydroxyphosphoribosylaminopyrimidine deaminase/5-amino-6-(5-phosphoribosylamino)uracil reductase RibD [Cereibacter sphaeroides]|uniref:bifunctional diaminohydroxyphosphoribosylaminopyrimidine deaminase/5-amino-6-(5-phosphoribosylamino)uracil reductase RibD n=1 Tax=Cereibacter sphaeroides TaxID=1063 RepID=UPI001EEDB3C9|nr:bifunctional diaminohydroxyphosphoribosylaminopyrimidine deaminase/5-amino-6-(5-phosphoribosylamino)uracil reductase RibD [Cereibacter sphaeroides]MCE6951016.1 bifunctional diaminohydroxyphosphoribosylaminopyrimidine deaminase/5-amino-6-(5-phosphoribosylamino)uracil reductase RibD [Cereibacter sphaeroides]MCE6960546.1 bifunctional diaminohydroxyphosphoribosylaminopyrimidine deaminase/5-amino-6-(5-phosphoribosylamino)uracil reductase RibD [Cereibacter sphaeroides]MCE6969496.1 bifunctional diam
MAHALALGARGLGRTWPNPAVGCVIVKGGRIVGRGWTQPGGRPHAETVALAQAGAAALGATAYVTLEPCAHHGRTPPCAEALIAAGVARVVTAAGDPDPRVAGQGHAMLRAAGIPVTERVMEAEARRLNAGFLKRVTEGLPFLTLKLAATADGRIATASGESRWITGAVARRAVHAMRMRHDAVLVGSGTALADDPDLSVREMGSAHQPVRIVIDSRLRHTPESRLGRTARHVPVWLCHGPDAPPEAREAWQAAGALLLECKAGPQGLDLRSVLRRLAAEGLTRVFCEGGATLAAGLVRAGLCDELVSFMAGKLIGAEGRAAMGPLHLLHLAEAPAFGLASVEAVGVDVLARWRPL